MTGADGIPPNGIQPAWCSSGGISFPQGDVDALLVSRLAAGLVHEINNPLGYLFSNFHTLRDCVGELVNDLGQEPSRSPCNHLKAEISTILDESLQGLCRIRDLVKKLGALAHAHEDACWQVSDLAQLSDSVLQEVATRLPPVTVQHTGHLLVRHTLVLPVAIRVLLDNAFDATQPDGAIHLTTFRHHDDVVALQISDTGPGIPAQLRPHVFEPFFTTKSGRDASGLGLTLALMVARLHGGDLQLESSPAGTVARLLLPACSVL